MSTDYPSPKPGSPLHPAHTNGPEIHAGHGAHGGHGVMMWACCIPMAAVALLLVISGMASAGALVWALGCVLMMAAMMLFMPGGHGRR